jgi:hypothetical protein
VITSQLWTFRNEVIKAANITGLAQPAVGIPEVIHRLIG